MLHRLFGRTEKDRPALAAGLRLFAIGDIHGRNDLLGRMLEIIEADLATSRTETARIIFLGDYVDRGLESAGVIERLARGTMPGGAEAVFLRGNHEQAMLDFMADPAGGSAWLRFGGVETLLSYGVHAPPGGTDDPGHLADLAAALADSLPAAHLDFLHATRTSHAEAGWFFTHAGIRPGVALDAQAPDDLLWIRQDFLDSPRDHGAIIVHGHTITAEPDVQENRIGIDTGAYMSGRLTCLVVEETGIRFLQAGRGA